MKPGLFLLICVLASMPAVPAQVPPKDQSVPRAVRRDVPMTNVIRRAFAAGTRDLTGRPGPKYWQLQTDFTIRARLDRPTLSIVGQETIVVHNHSPSELTEIVLRLDHNIFRARVPRGSSVPAETTDGMVVTRLVVDGANVDLTRQARRSRRFGRRLAVRGLDQTVARVSLATPVAAGGKVTLEIDWRTRLPGGDGGRGHRMTQRWDDTLFQPDAVVSASGEVRRLAGLGYQRLSRAGGVLQQLSTPFPNELSRNHLGHQRLSQDDRVKGSRRGKTSGVLSQRARKREQMGPVRGGATGRYEAPLRDPFMGRARRSFIHTIYGVYGSNSGHT